MRSLFLVAALMSAVSYGAPDAATQFETQCTACHTIGGGKKTGPDLIGLSSRRPREWILRWMREPDVMLAEKDPTAMDLLKTYLVPMPNQQVTEEQAVALLAYIDEKSTAAAKPAAEGPTAGEDSPGADAVKPTAPVEPDVVAKTLTPAMGDVQKTALWVFLGFVAFIVVVFWWTTTAQASSAAVNMQSAYKVRSLIFWIALPVIVGLLGFTLPKAPYVADAAPDRVIYVATRQFEFIFSNEPITTAEDVTRIPHIRLNDLPAGALIEFRVTSLDVTHNFAVYDFNGAVKAQVQAMPGYVNRLRTRFESAGAYPILCLEYCGLAHHVMRSAVTVK